MATALITSEFITSLGGAMFQVGTGTPTAEIASYEWQVDIEKEYGLLL